MSYIKTKLSCEDKDILKEIYDELEKINIPKSFRNKISWSQGHQLRTGTFDQKEARQTVFGLITYQGKQITSKSTIKYPHIMQLFREFIESHYPSTELIPLRGDFKFRSVYVNKNTVAKKHLDSNNIGESLLVGLGSYTGGRTVLYSPVGSNLKKFNIKTHSLIFNGSELPHKSEPFRGIRYSLVFFN